MLYVKLLRPKRTAFQLQHIVNFTVLNLVKQTRQEKWHFTAKKPHDELAKCGIFYHFPVFTKRKIQSFPQVFVPVNSSIRSIIRQFSVTGGER